MRRGLIFSLFSNALFASTVAAAHAAEAPALSPAWLKLYQYKKTLKGYESNAVNPRFFFTAGGATDPQAEFDAATAAFASSPEAGCAFPARFAAAKKLLNAAWREPHCPDLNDWLERLNADRVSIVYASAYTGNPASLMGHTFLRFYSGEKEKSREALGLLSYAVGFLAQPDKQYGQIRYFYKGLTGGFVGVYDIEPFYIKVGLYNNSESRDLFEQPLNFSKDETIFLQKYLWEVIFKGGFPYYFLDENCSYRILTALEAARPSLGFTSKNDLFVLPAETVRDLLESGVAGEPERFRASIRRRLAVNFANMTAAQKENMHAARRDAQALEQTGDPAVLDALMDEWKYRNYRAKTALPPAEAELMQRTFARRARITAPSPPSPTDAEIAARQALVPPYKSHRPHALTAGAGYLNKELTAGDEALITLSGQAGAHSRRQNPQGYFTHSEIEYFSFSADYGTESKTFTDWEVILARVKAVEPLSSLEKNWSWQFTAGIEDECRPCVSGGVGGALQRGPWSAYFMPLAAVTKGVGYDTGLKRVTPASFVRFSFTELHSRKEYTRVFELEARYLKARWPSFSFKNETISSGPSSARLSLSFIFD